MLYARRSARVLLVDQHDRILLFRLPWSSREPELGHLWITPGGGIEEGEEPVDAAARELREEIGLPVHPADLLPLVCYTEGHADDIEQRSGLFRDDFFFHRTQAFDIDESGQEPWERQLLMGHRWWTPQELRATTERVVPLGLTDLLADLLVGRLPAEPLRLAWHH